MNTSTSTEYNLHLYFLYKTFTNKLQLANIHSAMKLGGTATGMHSTLSHESVAFYWLILF